MLLNAECSRNVQQSTHCNDGIRGLQRDCNCEIELVQNALKLQEKVLERQIQRLSKSAITENLLHE